MKLRKPNLRLPALTLAAIVTSSSLLLSGCATTDMQAAMEQIRKTFSTQGAEASESVSNRAGQGRNSLPQTPLMGVFSRSPSTDGRAPEWPKVVITNLTIPAEQASPSRLRLRADDCVVFDAVLWHDAKNHETFNDVSLCAPELPKRSNGFVTTWRTFPISGKTSGQVRGDGPTPPYSKLPGDALMDRWMNGPGIYFVGSMLTMMGYEPQFSADDRRFWVKNVRGS